MSILVTGGAGYIGSVTVELLQERGLHVVVLDDLNRGHRAAVDPSVPIYVGKIGDRQLVERIVRENRVDSCVHFAALAYIGESMIEPAKYFSNNAAQGLEFLNALLASGVKRVVFSSTCASYGEPREALISESHPQRPVNPYGWSKFFLERALECYDQAYGLKFISLRYFNAAGATRAHGEDHEPETHLIPNALAAASGKIPYVTVFGSDYATDDGTAVRDYIHVADLGRAHLLALRYLESGGDSNSINLGVGRGFSVLEVIKACRRVSGRAIDVRFAPRRPGDPPRLVSEREKARNLLGWVPHFLDLDSIVSTAWDWHQRHPCGYATGV